MHLIEVFQCYSVFVFSTIFGIILQICCILIDYVTKVYKYLKAYYLSI